MTARRLIGIGLLCAIGESHSATDSDPSKAAETQIKSASDAGAVAMCNSGSRLGNRESGATVPSAPGERSASRRGKRSSSSICDALNPQQDQVGR